MAVDLLEGPLKSSHLTHNSISFLGSMYDRIGLAQKVISQMNKVLEMDKDHVQALNYLATHMQSWVKILI
ncbi:MAG: hypothetical protein R2827_00785 [Bdellovibrionales bacterium]